MQGLIALIIFLYIPAVIVLVRNIFRDTYFWQIKEYRVDRVISSLRYREEPSDRNKILNIIQYGLFLSSIIFFIQPVNVLLIIPILAFGSYWIEAWNVVQDFLSKKLTRPKKSIRNLLIAAVSLAIMLLPALLPIKFVINLYNENQITNLPPSINAEQVRFTDFLINEKQITGQESDIVEIPLVAAVAMITTFLILTADLSTSLVVSFMAIVTEPLAQIKRKKLISLAKSKIKHHKGFKVIAITGSYGKTTTKEILFALIKDNFQTAKTRENHNSTVGIAQEVAANLMPETEVFIAEMGAYKKGEIKKSCGILQPDISIVTAIGPQHLSLFGSIENIVKAKYEIIENLKPNGLAIFNADNQYCLQMATKSKNRELLYFIIGESEDNKIQIQERAEKNSKAVAGHLSASKITQIPNGFRFQIIYNKISLPVQIKITGKHNISNILAAIAAALELGMDIKSIIAKLQNIDLPQIHLVWKKGIKGTTILDDGYNSNIEGFKEAIKIITEKNSKSNKAQNIVITKGLIELSSSKKDIYKDLVEQLGKNINVVITSDKDLLDLIKINTKNVKGVYARESEQFFNALELNSKKGDFILLEGALPPKFLDQAIL